MELGPRIILRIGNIPITETVLFSLIISILILVFAFFATRRMERIPKGAQAVGELIVGTVYNMVGETMGGEAKERFAPYMGTLFLYLAFGSCLGLFELRPVTADLNCTVPLALVSFIMIHYNAVKAQTAKGYIKHLAEPYAFIFPMNIMSDVMFPITLACRIFGNITAGVILMTLMYDGLKAVTTALGSVVPFFQIGIPLPFHFFFDMFEPGLQAYIFVMLTMVFTANGMNANEEH
ncbi:MAG: F0F1 ATP synthase subunit A [Clostridiales bacterium]|nr:F0F1 ATP synthase subunit A [Clostridiales bacterium]